MNIRKTGVEWSGFSWNPWIGCVKKTIEISGRIVLREECRNCYMYRERRRYGHRMPQKVTRTHSSTFRKPLAIQKMVDRGELKKNSPEVFIFTSSWTDFFNPEADGWRGDAWGVIRETRDLIYQLLTKLPERIGDHLPSYWDEIRDRVWLGYTCGMPGSEFLIDHLYGHGAAVRYLSCEPLLGDIDVSPYFNSPVPFGDDEKINWIIGGGESGSKAEARPTRVEWGEDLLLTSKNFGIPFFWKQTGSWRPRNLHLMMADKVNLLDDKWFQFDGDHKRVYEYMGVHWNDPRMLAGKLWEEFPINF